MRYLSLVDILDLHRRVVEQSGGAGGVRDLSGIESAVSQPLMTFDSRELYPTLDEKAAALCYSLVMNHPFVDGNKRIGHAAMECFLMLNGFEIRCNIDDAENFFLELAGGQVSRGELVDWIARHAIPITDEQAT